jgi:tRNA pseudouridine55 synthase
LILLNKPAGITSFEALAHIKNTLRTRKVGHAGTLDKFACGLLIVLCGKMTKCAMFFTDLAKTYETEVTLGKETETLDPEGAVVAEGEVPEQETIEKVIPRFIGEIEQTPPLYSAVHVHGERAYRLAKQGKNVVLEKRRVEIKDITMKRYDPPFLYLTVECSKGTYIRSLARDIAREAGSNGYVSRLERTRIGEYHVENAIEPDSFDLDRDLITGPTSFDGLPQIAVAYLKRQYVKEIQHGKAIKDHFFVTPPGGDGLYALFTDEALLIALVDKRGNTYQYKFVSDLS